MLHQTCQPRRHHAVRVTSGATVRVMAAVTVEQQLGAVWSHPHHHQSVRSERPLVRLQRPLHPSHRHTYHAACWPRARRVKLLPLVLLVLVRLALVGLVV